VIILNKQQATSNKQQATSNKQQATSNPCKLILLFIFALTLTFSACGSDDNDTKSSQLPDLDGSGIAGDPFLVGSAADLRKVGRGPDGNWTSAALGAHYELTENINLENAAWEPIGYVVDQDNPDWDTTFTGSFDGGSFTISNLTIKSTSDDLVGLFGVVGLDGTVENLCVENITITDSITGTGNDVWTGGIAGVNAGTIKNCSATGNVSGDLTGIVAGDDSAVGAIVGLNYFGTIENCFITGNVAITGNNWVVGGITGVNEHGTIKDCSVSGNITGTVDWGGVGGIAGGNSDAGTIENCFVTGTVTGTANWGVGGIVGVNIDASTIKNCYVTGYVTGNGNSVGGIAGLIFYGTIENCYNTGNVTGTGDESVGGIAGDNSGEIKNCYVTGTGTITGSNEWVGGITGINDGKIENCYVTGSVSVTGYQCVGGIVGSNSDGGTIKNCYATVTVTGAQDVGGIVGGNYVGCTIENCVALNATVSASGNGGRVVGSSSPGLSNNYALSSMSVTGNIPSDESSGGKDGGNITSEYYNAIWWTGTANWDLTIWKIENSKLPTLRGVGGDQEPTL